MKNANERNEKYLRLYDDAINLAIYTEQKCNNENVCPKRLRWCSTNDLIMYAERLAVEIKLANKANIFEEYDKRKEHQFNANECLEAMLTKLDIIRKRNHPDSDTLEYWVGLIVNLKTGISNWKKSDKRRYEQHLIDIQSHNEY